MRQMRRILLIMVVAALAVLSLAGCKKKTGSNVEKCFTLVVVDKEGNEETFDVKTKMKSVGEALVEGGMVEGKTGPYGLEILKVNGIEARYDKDGTYWAFYINGEYAQTSVDMTEIEDGATYMLKVEGN